jgi:hypothetical protein
VAFLFPAFEEEFRIGSPRTKEMAGILNSELIAIFFKDPKLTEIILTISISLIPKCWMVMLGERLDFSH